MSAPARLSNPEPGFDREVIVVGAGVAGLAAAWRLRERDVLVLERRSRAGGRIKSLPRDELWINLGAHLFAGRGSAVHELLQAMELQSDLLDIPGSKSAVYAKGRVRAPRRAELLPLTLDMSFSERISLARAGLRLRRGVVAWRRSQQRRAGESADAWYLRAARFGSEQTMAQLLGAMPRDVEAIFRSAARRAAGELDELSAGAGLSLFGALWVGKGSASQLNVRGGSGRLGEAAQRWLGDRLRLETTVTRVEAEEWGAVVSVRRDGVDQDLKARRVIVALPAPQARKTVGGLPTEVDRSLASVTYGPFVSMGVLTGRSDVAPWRDVYAITTPELSFDMLFNHANALSHRGEPGMGGSFMCYAGGRPARQLLESSPEQIRERFLSDLYRVYPQLRGLVQEAVVQKWPIGNVHATPRTSFEAMYRYSTRPGSPVRFAGDYFAPLGGTLDAAARSGFDAADAVLSDLATTSRQETSVR